MNKFLITTALMLAFGAAPAHAVTATFCGPASEGGACEGTGEVKVFLDSAKNATTVFGDVGSQKNAPTIDFTSDGGTLDFSSGFGTIKTTIGENSFAGLDITIPGFTFTDLVFDVQTTGQKGDVSEAFTVDAFSGADVLDGIGNEIDNSDTDKTFSVFASGGAFDEVNITAAGGFNEIKHIEISGLAAVPEPSTWALMGLGFGLLGFLGYRKTRGALA